MKKILVPVDFSPHTVTSCRYALYLAAKTGAEITLFHSFFDQIYFSDGGFSTGFESGLMLTDEIIIDFFKQKEKSLKGLADEMSSKIAKTDDHTVKISYRLESGDPEVQIMNIIHKVNPDLIIMGSSGIGRKSLLAGSVARKIMNSTNIPVIAIPEKEQEVEIENVAYMTNFDPDDHLAIKELDNILSGLNLNIHCLHLCKGQSFQEADKELASLKQSNEVGSLQGRISFEVRETGNVKETLNLFIKENNIDLIAFIPHKRNIFKNLIYQGLTKEHLYQTSKPMMAVQPRSIPD